MAKVKEKSDVNTTHNLLRGVEDISLLHTNKHFEFLFDIWTSKGRSRNPFNNAARHYDRLEKERIVEKTKRNTHKGKNSRGEDTAKPKGIREEEKV